MNEAKDGFFNWLSLNYQCSYVMVECKNYGEEIGNPELDQTGSGECAINADR